MFETLFISLLQCIYFKLTAIALYFPPQDDCGPTSWPSVIPTSPSAQLVAPGGGSYEIVQYILFVSTGPLYITEFGCQGEEGVAEGVSEVRGRAEG